MLPQCSHTSTDTKSRKCQHRNTIRGARDGTARTPFTTAPDRYGKSAKPPLLPLPRRFTILAISPAGLIAINARFETEGTTGGEHRQNEHLAPQIQISDFATTQLSTMALLVACARQTAPGRNDQSFTLNELLDKSWSQAPFPFSCPPPPRVHSFILMAVQGSGLLCLLCSSLTLVDFHRFFVFGFAHAPLALSARQNFHVRRQESLRVHEYALREI